MVWPVWAIYVALTVVSVGLSILLAPKAPSPPPAELEDFDAPTAEEGRPIPVVFGTVKITGSNILWYGNLTTTPIKTKGGKK